ncbi:DUF4362 domain-containing protein [Neobacillus drentensis]|uniref:DUF4362 domain-containing protein n=1 Tax=Neobacillus drentensis TaxID=220684 RepID=UPI002FFE6E72
MKIKIFSTILLLMLLVSCQQGATDNPKSPYPSEKAIKNGDIVNVHGEITNVDRFNQFIKNVNQKVEDKVRITSYTTEGDPIFYNLNFNGKEIEYTYDASQDSYGGSDKQSTTCSVIVSSTNENGVEYHLSKCSSNVGETFYFQIPK